MVAADLLRRKTATEIGRFLILHLCGYEVLALEVERHAKGSRLAKWIRPLSYYAHRHRQNPVAWAVIGGLATWLIFHLVWE